MSIEKLTDDERLNIGCMSGRDGEFARKALRIIDQLTEALATAERDLSECRETASTRLAYSEQYRKQLTSVTALHRDAELAATVAEARVRELEASIVLARREAKR